MTSRSVLRLVALVGVCIASSSARANNQPPPPGLVFVTGTVPAADLSTISGSIEKVVRVAGWVLPAKQLPRTESERILKCVKTDALPKCFQEAAPVPRVFVVTAEIGIGSDGLPFIELTGQAFATGAATPTGLESAIRTQTCENCSGTKLREASDKLAEIVLHDLALRMRRTFIELMSKPAGARVFLDGTGIGVTNGTFNTYPGEHEVRFEMPGYISETRNVTVKENETAPVAVELRAETPQLPVRPPGETPSKVLPLALVVGGGAIFGTGVAWSLYATKGGPVEAYRYTRALQIGIPTAIVGAGVAAVGVVWLVKRSRSSMPTASVTSQGAVVGWMGAF